MQLKSHWNGNAPFSLLHKNPIISLAISISDSLKNFSTKRNWKFQIPQFKWRWDENSRTRNEIAVEISDLETYLPEFLWEKQREHLRSFRSSSPSCNLHHHNVKLQISEVVAVSGRKGKSNPHLRFKSSDLRGGSGFSERERVLWKKRGNARVKKSFSGKV